jgi:erythromycin esterase-like protein
MEKQSYKSTETPPFSISLKHPHGMISDTQRLRDAVIPLNGSPGDFDALIKKAEKCRVVLLGEASHGTHEFYRIRAEITKRLIRELGFDAVAVEADWPDAYRINRYVRGCNEDAEAIDSLGGFRRFPQWMWRNTDVLDFVGWLRNFNESVTDHDRKGSSRGAIQTGFYGLDLYSLNASMEAVIGYLSPIDPDAARRVAEHYACFDNYGGDTQRYGLLSVSGMTENCKQEVLSALSELHAGRTLYLKRDGKTAAEDYFNAEQNARVVRNAEEYYRTMFRGDVSSWNLRDRHMMHSLLLLIEHLKQTHGGGKIVVWAHNSHLGNAAATSMGERGEFNIGQLVREHFGRDALSVGFTTDHGTVTAASEWNAPAERKQIRPALAESYELLFHQTGIPRFWLDCHASAELTRILEKPRLERAIGVIYRPETERASHYFHSRLPEQFDALFHYDETRAVEPLERSVEWIRGETEETYPSGL